jgi:hypothetical protein
MRKMKLTKLLMLFAVASVALTSCYKNDTVYTEDYDLVLTYYDTDFDYSVNKTFYIRDSVGLISDYIEQGDDQWDRFYRPGGASPQIRNEVIRQMKNYGYTQILDSLGDADVAVNMVASLFRTEGVAYYPGYWGYYPGYWWGYYPGWDPYYPGYPWYGGGTYYEYTTANLMIEIADGDSLRALIKYVESNPGADPADPQAPKMKYLWQAFVNGILTENGEYDMDRVLRGIDQAFEQSTYLKVN